MTTRFSCCGDCCASAAYICVIDEASAETGHSLAVYDYCNLDEYSTDDPVTNIGYLHSLVSTSVTGLPAFGATGLALVGLELCVVPDTGLVDPPLPTMTGTDCHELDAVQIFVNETGFGQDIIDEIETRFGATTVDGELNPHPRRIYFIIDDSGSYNISDFEDEYDFIKTHYTDAGWSTLNIENRFGKLPCAETMTAITAVNGRYVTAMLPSESWFAACKTMILDHIGV